MKFYRIIASTLTLSLFSGTGVASTGSARPEIPNGNDGQMMSTLDVQEFTLDQRLEEFYAVVGNIEEYYGMLDYKQKRFKFNWNEVKKEYLVKISAPDVDRPHFIALMQEMVANFRDGHTSAISFRDAYLSGNSVMYSTLGFTTKRVIENGKNNAVVSRVFDKFFRENSPVLVGDVILSIDNKTPEEIVANEIIKSRNLGQDESNLTSGFSALTTRNNLQFAILPTGEATVKFRRGGKEMTAVLRWLKVDPSELVSNNSNGAGLFQKNFTQVNGDGTYLVEEKLESDWSVDRLPNMNKAIANSMQRMQMAYSMDVFLGELLDVEVGHDYPEGGNVTFDGMTFNLRQTAKGLIAIYRIEDFVFSRLTCKQVVQTETFRMAFCSELSEEDYARAFKKLGDLGVKALVLDLRHNGGGMISTGYKLFRAFVKGDVKANLASLRLNEEWLGMLKAGAEQIRNASVRDLGKRVYSTLLKDVDRHQRYSTPIYPFGEETLRGANEPWNGKTFILADEMCASMCDIFITLMQDYQLATFIGKQTMGAGGNVISVPPTPHTKIRMNMTASRIFRLDGSTIENEGAKPDISVSSTTGPDFWNKVQATIEAAL